MCISILVAREWSASYCVGQAADRGILGRKKGDDQPSRDEKAAFYAQLKGYAQTHGERAAKKDFVRCL
jgi:hypothetical protein